MISSFHIWSILHLSVLPTSVCFKQLNNRMAANKLLTLFCLVRVCLLDWWHKLKTLADVFLRIKCNKKLLYLWNIFVKVVFVATFLSSTNSLQSVFEEKLGSLPEFMLATTVKTYRQTCPLSWSSSCRTNISEKMYLSVTSQGFLTLLP